MIGVDIIGELLRGNGLVTAKVVIANIKPGRLPDDAPMPTLLVQSISVIERLKLKRTGLIRWTERVSVTVRAKTYAEKGMIIKLLPSACAGKVGTVAGATGVSVINAGIGPDVNGAGNSFEQAIDFRVSYEIAA